MVGVSNTVVVFAFESELGRGGSSYLDFEPEQVDSYWQNDCDYWAKILVSWSLLRMNPGIDLNC